MVISLGEEELLSVRHRLPGRLRLQVAGLKSGRLSQVSLSELLQRHPAITAVQANSLTGSLLILYRPAVLGEAELIKQVGEAVAASMASSSTHSEAPGPVERRRIQPRRLIGSSGGSLEATDNSRPGTSPDRLAPAAVGQAAYGPADHTKDVLRLAGVGLLLGVLSFRRVVRGVSPLSARLTTTAALVSILAGYPVLKRGLSGAGRGRVFNTDLLLATASFALMLTRESLPGVVVLFLTETLNVAEKAASAKARASYLDLAGEQSIDLRRPTLLPADAERLTTQVENTTKLTLALAGGVYFLRRDSQQALAMLVAGVPAAVKLAESTVSLAGQRHVNENGYLLGDGRHLLALPSLDTVVWCEAQIFSAGPVVKDFHVLDPAYPVERLLGFTAAAYREVPHPLGPALWRQVQEQGIQPPRARGAELLPGGAVRAVVDQHKLLIGSRSTLRRARIACDHCKTSALRYEQLGLLPYYIVVDGRPVGLLAVEEQLRENVEQTIEMLRVLGITRQVLLSSSGEEYTELLAGRLGLEHWQARMTSGGKAAIVKELKDSGRLVMTVGSSQVDVEAMTQSDFSLALGVPLPEADMYSLQADPGRIADIFRLAKQAREIYRQNLLLARAGNLIGIGLAFTKVFNASAAMFGQKIVSLILLINAGRLRWVEEKAEKEMRPDSEQAAAALETVAPSAALEGHPVVQVVPAPEAPNLDLPALLETLQTDLVSGLTSGEVERRLQLYRQNVLLEPAALSFWSRMRDQLDNQLVQLLTGASVVNAFLGHLGDAASILAIVAVNALLGALQESKAEQSIRALRSMQVPVASVIRDGAEQEIPAALLVPGDVVLLRSGDKVPADLRLFSEWDLDVDESCLTGESYPVAKSHQAGGSSACLYMGTGITRGRAQAVVFATGMNTQMGLIAAMLRESHPQQTPLQQNLGEVGSRIMQYSLGACAVLIVSGLLRGRSLMEMLLSGASLAVAAIPEGLPAIATVALAVGVQRMARRQAIVRRLSAVETLGCATVICCDKTGTLTQNQMTVRVAYTDRWWSVSGDGYNPQGDFRSEGRQGVDDSLRLALLASCLCNDARLIPPQSGGSAWQIAGDPTEGALLVAAAKAGLWQEELKQQYRIERMIPFESNRRCMLVACSGPDGQAWVFAKGAPEAILNRCGLFLDDGKEIAIGPARRLFYQQQTQGLSEQALRVLAVSYKRITATELEQASNEDLEKNLAFAGLIAMCDPPRPEVGQALTTCRQAGIEVKMITGDHPATARAIALELGLMADGDPVLTGAELDGLDADQLAELVPRTKVFAQVLPRHKYEIVRSLKGLGEVVVMTGDGANDAPAVKEADIGIAMGKIGTAVTREAASLVLSDDNFTTIVAAVEEGRGTYQNIRRSLQYLLGTNAGEVILMLGAVFLGLPLPLLPLQLLWINLIGDGLPAIALSVSPPDPEVMRQPPRRVRQGRRPGGGLLTAGYEPLMNHDFNRRLLVTGLSSGLTVLLAYRSLLKTRDLTTARTLAFGGLTAQQIVYSLACSPQGLPSTMLTGASAVSVGLLALSLYLPFGQRLFGTRALSLGDWVGSAPLILLPAVMDYMVERVSSRNQLTADVSRSNTPCSLEKVE
jgi:Ca2+-transporting ATPase